MPDHAIDATAALLRVDDTTFDTAVAAADRPVLLAATDDPAHHQRLAEVARRTDAIHVALLDRNAPLTRGSLRIDDGDLLLLDGGWLLERGRHSDALVTQMLDAATQTV